MERECLRSLRPILLLLLKWNKKAFLFAKEDRSDGGKSTRAVYSCRGTLKRTYEKLTKDKKLRIVYFGGSITVGFGSTDVEEKSWRALSGKWFREMFPQAEIELIRSAVGESGTYLGVYRLDRDIISLRPDLLNMPLMTVHIRPMKNRPACNMKPSCGR